MKSSRIKILNQSVTYFLVLIFSILIISCNTDPSETDPVVNVVRFERNSNLVWSRSDVGGLEVINDRMYYSNVLNPGYFDLDGTQNQFSMRGYDMRFGHSFTEKFTVGVSENRRTLVVLPNIDYNTLQTTNLNSITIPDFPNNYLLQPGWFERPNFALNENYLLSSWERPLSSDTPLTHERVFILELNVRDNGLGNNGLIIDRDEPVLNKIFLNYEIDGLGFASLISLYPFDEGWIGSANIAGYDTSFKIERNGDVAPLRDSFERFVILSLEQNSSGHLFATTEDGLFRSETGSPFELERVATVNQFLRVKFIADRMVAWIGTDRIVEIRNYENASEIEVVELENAGLEDTFVKNIAFFGGKFYVATNAGLFSKDENEFWTEKDVINESAAMEIGWEPNFK